VVVCALLLAAACAEHASSSPIEVDIVAGHFAGFDDPNGLHFTDEEARCTAERIVRSLGVARLGELGLAVDADTPPELSEPPLTQEEGDAVFAAIDECIDLEGQIVDFIAGGDVSEAQAGCVARRYLATDLPRRALLSGYDPELNAEIDATMDQAAGQCGLVWAPD
jgi:hypothetical protein